MAQDTFDTQRKLPSCELKNTAETLVGFERHYEALKNHLMVVLMPDHVDKWSKEHHKLIHPAVRAIILHFWLAYDHPFVDGNGRTARALFYWSMLRSGYWLFEFISISAILHKAPVQYGRSFLHTETDDNDLTYFLIAQIEVISQALDELHRYIERKAEAEQDIQALALFNHRQVALIRHALSNPGQRYTIASHQQSHAVAYQTARTDLLDLAERGVLEMGKKGRALIFAGPADVAERLAALEKQP